MLPPWTTTPAGSRRAMPTKADILGRALSQISSPIASSDQRDKSQRVYDSIRDSANTFSSSVNSILGSAYDALPLEKDQFFRANANYL